MERLSNAQLDAVIARCIEAGGLDPAGQKRTYAVQNGMSALPQSGHRLLT